MTKSDEILLKLLRIAFGNEADLSLPENTDWNSVMDISFAQDVSSLAVSAYQKIVNAGLFPKSPLDSPEMEDLKYDWFGQNLVQETDYEHQWKIACRLSDLFLKHGLITYIIKGFSIAIHYPVPNHRSCCDVDIFLVPSDGSYVKDHDEAFQSGNELVSSLHLKVNDNFYKNSAFTVKGVTFENHRFVTPIRGGKRRKQYEKYLQSILQTDDGGTLENASLRYPSPLFTLLFTISHAMNHFLAEGGINLRHVCDWAALMSSYNDPDNNSNGLWETFVVKCREFGLWKFACSLSRVAERVCGVRIPFDCPVNKKADECLLEEILDRDKALPDFSDSLATRIKNTISMIRSSWKFSLYSDSGMIRTLLEMLFGFFFEKKPELK